MSGAIGREVSRVDGPAKVTGAARYSGEIALPDLAYAEIVGAGLASGRITSIDTAQAERAEGVAGILTHRNLPKVNTVPLVPSLMGGPAPGETFFPMQDEMVHYAASRSRSSSLTAWSELSTPRRWCRSVTLRPVSYDDRPGPR